MCLQAIWAEIVLVFLLGLWATVLLDLQWERRRRGEDLIRCQCQVHRCHQTSGQGSLKVGQTNPCGEALHNGPTSHQQQQQAYWLQKVILAVSSVQHSMIQCKHNTWPCHVFIPSQVFWSDQVALVLQQLLHYLDLTGTKSLMMSIHLAAGLEEKPHLVTSDNSCASPHFQGFALIGMRYEHNKLKLLNSLRAWYIYMKPILNYGQGSSSEEKWLHCIMRGCWFCNWKKY